MRRELSATSPILTGAGFLELLWGRQLGGADQSSWLLLGISRRGQALTQAPTWYFKSSLHQKLVRWVWFMSLMGWACPMSPDGFP